MNKYYISKHTIEDEVKELFRTDIGKETQTGDLLYSAWGSSPTKSRSNAGRLVKALERDQIQKQNQKTA